MSLDTIFADLKKALSGEDEIAVTAEVVHLSFFVARQLQRIADALEARNAVAVTTKFEVHDAQGRLDL